MGNHKIVLTDEFVKWWSGLSKSDQKSVAAKVEVLEEHGTDLGYPHTSKIRGSRHSRMRELRVQSSGKPIRILYVFDTRRNAVLLVGKHKNNDKRFYDKLVQQADKLYDDYVED